MTGPIPPEQEASTLLSSQVQFVNQKVKEADDKLINFIKQHTGKIKPLAIADLESFIATGMEMFNMGKTFELEGIGNIQKNKSGQLEFVAGETPTTRHEVTHHENDRKVSVFEDNKYEPRTNPLQKILAFGLLLGGIAIVVLGGYYLYNMNNNPEKEENETLNSAPIQQPLVDTASTATVDSALITKQPSTFKFILELANSKQRAQKRYNQLKSMAIDIKMDTLDSNNFKLYFVIPSMAADTIRIKDSLQNYYGRKIRIEQ